VVFDWYGYSNTSCAVRANGNSVAIGVSYFSLPAAPEMCAPRFRSRPGGFAKYFWRFKILHTIHAQFALPRIFAISGPVRNLTEFSFARIKSAPGGCRSHGPLLIVRENVTWALGSTTS
jgi:hypothetical protein